MLKDSSKFTGVILTLSFAVVTLFGLNMGMDMRQDGRMSGCAFDSSATCHMNSQEHINHWQQTFTATQPTQSTMLALLAGMAFGGTALLFHSWLNWQRYDQKVHSIPQSVHKQREIIAKLSNHVLRALSNGTLNPVLYNFSYNHSRAVRGHCHRSLEFLPFPLVSTLPFVRCSIWNCKHCTDWIVNRTLKSKHPKRVR
ncbi:hypothetical protein K9L63_00875 [Candidatus Gracilibacteria bacterium]|nr:hypothetical protein [Candidatus Gracilibacteria bacterium]